MVASVPRKIKEVFMERRMYRVVIAADGGAKNDRVFEGNEYELKRRFPLEDYPEPLFKHRQENPRKEVTFYFKLYSSSNGKDWTIETVDPRLT